MEGLMQDCPLTVDRFLDYADRWHPRRDVVTRASNGDLRRTDYRTVARRARKVSSALKAAGIDVGDRIATLAWNSDFHVESWYGIVGIGAVCHTLNPRLFPKQLAYIINHAQDRLIFADPSCADLLTTLLPECPTIECVIFLCSEDERPDMPFPATDFEGWISGHSSDVSWGGFDERTACGLCYTSGTTGNPKGVLYSHRSNYIHTLATLQVGVHGLSALDTVLLMTPIYHANGWGIIYSAPAVGSRLVLPGRQLDGASLYELIEREGVTYSGGVPSLWQAVLEHARDGKRGFSTLRRVTIGGSACTEAMFREFREFGVDIRQGWGMTEAGPLAAITSPIPEVAALPEPKQFSYLRKVGRPLVGVDIKVINDQGHHVPHDGVTPGVFKVRGATIAREYYGGSSDFPLDDEGYFDTGDIVTVDELGFIQMMDRSKDMIKSGGEWISSVEIENIAADHPKIEISGVIAMPHERYHERPLIVAKLRAGQTLTRAELLDHLRGRMAKWSLPDDVIFVDEMPLGATGKVDKKELRRRFGGLPPAKQSLMS